MDAYIQLYCNLLLVKFQCTLSSRCRDTFGRVLQPHDADIRLQADSLLHMHIQDENEFGSFGLGKAFSCMYTVRPNMYALSE